MSLNLIKDTYWKFSAKNLLKNHRCDYNICKGKCCKGPTFWPGRASDDGECINLYPSGCQIPIQNRPITCLLYPLVLNKNNTIIRHFRCRAICKTNCELGKPIIEELFWCFSSLFGNDQASYLKQEILKGKDTILLVPKDIVLSLLEEKECARKNWFPPYRISTRK